MGKQTAATSAAPPGAPSPNSTRSDLAAALQRLTAKLNAYDGVAATVERWLETPIQPDDAARLHEALHHGSAVTFTARKARLRGHARRRQVRRQRSRERRPCSRRASSSSRSSSAAPPGSDSDEPE